LSVLYQANGQKGGIIVGTIRTSVTVLFEDPFWIALYERWEDRRYEVCKITFGAEPKDYQVYAFLCKNWKKLRFSPVVQTKKSDAERINPKRMQRLIHRQVKSTGVGTKAQQALKLFQEQNKLVRKENSRERREEEKDRRYELHREKAKEKHKGH
jgi:hypothetical protein